MNKHTTIYNLTDQQILDSNHRTELEDEAMLLLNQQVRDMARLLLERVE